MIILKSEPIIIPDAYDELIYILEHICNIYTCLNLRPAIRYVYTNRQTDIRNHRLFAFKLNSTNKGGFHFLLSTQIRINDRKSTLGNSKLKTYIR